MTHGSNPDDRARFLDMLPDGARAAFTLLGVRRRYAVGDVLINEGDHAQELVVLHEGLVKVTARLDGDRESLMDIKIAGDVVGELAAMDLGPRSATVTACGDVVATVVPGHELVPFLLANPETSLALNRLLCGRLRRSDRWRLEFGGYPVPVRLARVLVELAVSYGRPDRNTVRIDVNLSQSEFAALTGSTTHTVHKALAQLRKDGLITTGIRQTHVRDLARLRKAARLSVPVG
ncbi:Crp/Fnr family transcriptional regulator [Streptomyces actinomycinicus]|uniref:Crp/Fnr family transcriptional regulator n=1 Tax=Streptomyces actinomycinicus TaxID=1695166 RepID=A0A937EN11_9ACTN|nr:Crp/Fnr family transcriptional regulator [Streptomyces actinomycinicus]MBL1085911.1 Crp/Fnr family transcriptional regulator [Streptomyces actinomycinicus]